MIFTNLITTNLRTKELGKDIEYYQRLESTNLESWELINDNIATHGMIVITDNQTNGKGRNGNTWFMSPSKGLTMSLILIKQMKIKDAALIPLAAGVAMAKTLKNRGVKPELKWPNDILIEGKKCGGILCETRVASELVSKMVLGLGLNVNETKNDFPGEIRDRVSSIYIDTGFSNQRELICAIFTTYFEQLLNDLTSTNRFWNEYCSHIEKEVSFNFNQKNHTGIFKGVNDQGKAIIDINGEIKKFTSIELIDF